MLPHRLRITRAAFSNTGKEMRAVSPHFSVSVRIGNNGCATIVSKKVEKTSVGRHRLKRRVLSILLPWCTPGRSIIVYARKGSESLPYPIVRNEVETLLAQLLGPVHTR